MGEVINGCTLPGKMISSVGAVCFGDTTDTAVVAACTVSACRADPALTRDQIPEIKRPATAITASAMTIQLLRERFPAPTAFKGRVCSMPGWLFSVGGNIK